MKRAALALSALLAACATSPEHENFKQVMNRQVGKSAGDPDAYPVLYRLRQVNEKTLPNGNRQLQYAAGRRGECKLYYEVQPGSLTIVRWAYEGSERECVIPPR